jgi:gamma-glutamyltranspeptidase/glutathione hydrolase
MVEKDFPVDVIRAMENMGYKVTNRGVIGRTEVIQLNWKGKKLINLEAVADKRGDDHASAY